jgi:hypothetical protein
MIGAWVTSGISKLKNDLVDLLYTLPLSDRQISLQSQLIAAKNYSKYPEPRIFWLINFEFPFRHTLSFLYKRINITTTSYLRSGFSLLLDVTALASSGAVPLNSNSVALLLPFPLLRVVVLVISSDYEMRVQQQRYRASVFLPLGKSQDLLDQFCFLPSARDGLLRVES